MRNEKKTSKKLMPKRKIYAIDLFCGAGGLTKGMENVGIDVRLGIDIDPACTHPYNYNNKAQFLLKNIEEVTVDELERKYRKNGIKLLAGCAPCQTFSTYNRKADQTDKRWWLLMQFARLIKEVSPELVTMENVPSLIDQDVFIKFLEDLKNANYHVSYQIVNCAEYGLPQQRKRLVLLASKFGEIELLSPSEMGVKPMTVRDAIFNLPHIDAGKVCSSDLLHQSSSLSETNLLRIKASNPGGTWLDWDNDLVAECHKKNSGKTYRSVYGRMEWDEPAPTITTQYFGFGNGRFGHPEQDRAISLREGAILQSFPEEYSFVEPGEKISIKAVGRMIGNAVPVKLGEVIGKSLLAHVAHHEAINNGKGGASVAATNQ
ncbi:DNA cytosine methyltransferase [Paenibacillus sp. FSL F4-0125]|uniref:DNA cytosine methyltransferase n=1 Tax=Paenibacillus sp. FSL F4-0125 TaxID=2954730 RepID=UPI0030F9DD11